MSFDEATIHVRSGDGGAGLVHFRREKFVPRGGPSGGDGGRGGDVYLVVKPTLNTLIAFSRQSHFRAENGAPGGPSNKTGRSADDLLIEVPPGTMVRDAATGALLADLTQPGQRVLVARGGRGGRGNARFATSTNQAPRIAEKGEPGEGRTLHLELKLLADVGLVGFPNAGKSTLLSVLSAAKPKIADYPFTTLEPNLGIVAYRDNQSFVMADIPGIIEGAAEGRGIGLRFLRHIERNSVLLFMIPADSSDIKADYAVLLGELEQYNPELLDKQRLLAITKCDLLDEQLMDEMRQDLPDIPSVFISSVSGLGLTTLKDQLWERLNVPQ